MSADIYTKAFPNAPEWQLATRLINHLDPELFWGGRRVVKAHVMPVEHKGGLCFDYWVANPWRDHTVKVVPAAPASPGRAPGRQDDRSGPTLDHMVPGCASPSKYADSTSSLISDTVDQTSRRTPPQEGQGRDPQSHEIPDRTPPQSQGPGPQGSVPEPHDHPCQEDFRRTSASTGGHVLNFGGQAVDVSGQDLENKIPLPRGTGCLGVESPCNTAEAVKADTCDIDAPSGKPEHLSCGSPDCADHDAIIHEDKTFLFTDTSRQSAVSSSRARRLGSRPTPGCGVSARSKCRPTRRSQAFRLQRTYCAY